MDKDIDNNKKIKYSINFGNEQSYFSIDENTGNITLDELIPLEDHQTEEYFLVITATDGRSLRCSPITSISI